MADSRKLGIGALSVAKIDNLKVLWIILIIAALGIGGIVVPASIITTIICPDDLIATVAALTLAIRVIGGAVGYCVYYNVSFNVTSTRFLPSHDCHTDCKPLAIGLRQQVPLKRSTLYRWSNGTRIGHHVA